MHRNFPFIDVVVREDDLFSEGGPPGGARCASERSRGVLPRPREESVPAPGSQPFGNNLNDLHLSRSQRLFEAAIVHQPSFGDYPAMTMEIRGLAGGRTEENQLHVSADHLNALTWTFRSNVAGPGLSQRSGILLSTYGQIGHLQ